MTGGHLYPTPWIRAWERIDADFDGHLEEIRRFLRCPTVSASGDDMLAGAEHVAALIEGAGGKAEIVATAGHPAVLGHIGGDGPRLLRYGMYDVQPAEEPGWSSPPFAAATTDVPGAGPSVVARGAANSKGALSAFLLAMASARVLFPSAKTDLSPISFGTLGIAIAASIAALVIIVATRGQLSYQRYQREVELPARSGTVR